MDNTISKSTVVRFAKPNCYYEGMSSIRQVKVIRGVNLLLFLILFILGAGLVVAQKNDSLPLWYGIGGIGLFLLLLIIRLYLESVLHMRLLLALERAELTDDSTFDMLYNNSPVAYVTINPSGTLIKYNSAAVNLLETNFQDLGDRSFFSLCDPAFDQSVLVEKIKAGLTISELEVPLQTVSGATVWVLLSVSALRGRGELLLTLVNITEQKKIDTAKSEFVALATHQLRTPLAAIRYATDLLTKHVADGQTDRNAMYLDKINRNVLRMLALINDFLNVSKLEMGTFATEGTTITVHEFLDEILEEFEGRIADQRIRVTRQGNPAMVTMYTDPRLLNIIMSNLISNAVKYTPSEGALDVSYTSDGRVIQFVITDSGIGIPAAEIPQLFRKFFRASNAQSQHTEGTGLGLYIVREAAKQLGGSIDVASEEGKGASFTVTLPLQLVR